MAGIIKQFHLSLHKKKLRERKALEKSPSFADIPQKNVVTSFVTDSRTQCSGKGLMPLAKLK
jgi:hypothetical protein